MLLFYKQVKAVQDATTDLACLPARMAAFGFTFRFQCSKACVLTSKEIGLDTFMVGVVVDCNGTANK